MTLWGIAATSLLMSGSALSHDHWINDKHLSDPISRQWCCNEEDCQPVEAGGVREQGGGYTIMETGEAIPYTRVIWKSEDGRWWRCRNAQNNSTRCLIGPPPAL